MWQHVHVLSRQSCEGSCELVRLIGGVRREISGSFKCDILPRCWKSWDPIRLLKIGLASRIWSSIADLSQSKAHPTSTKVKGTASKLLARQAAESSCYNMSPASKRTTQAVTTKARSGCGICCNKRCDILALSIIWLGLVVCQNLCMYPLVVVQELECKIFCISMPDAKPFWEIIGHNRTDHNGCGYSCNSSCTRVNLRWWTTVKHKPFSVYAYFLMMVSKKQHIWHIICTCADQMTIGNRMLQNTSNFKHICKQCCCSSGPPPVTYQQPSTSRDRYSIFSIFKATWEKHINANDGWLKHWVNHPQSTAMRSIQS